MFDSNFHSVTIWRKKSQPTSLLLKYLYLYGVSFHIGFPPTAIHNFVQNILNQIHLLFFLHDIITNKG